MADIKEVTVSLSCRVNHGNYEGSEHFVSVKAELDELDDAREVAAELRATAERAMHAGLVRSYGVRRKKLTDEQIARQHGLSGMA